MAATKLTRIFGKDSAKVRQAANVDGARGNWRTLSTSAHGASLRVRCRDLAADSTAAVRHPLSSEYGAHKTVTVRFWSWLSCRNISNLVISSLFARQPTSKCAREAKVESVCQICIGKREQHQTFQGFFYVDAMAKIWP